MRVIRQPGGMAGTVADFTRNAKAEAKPSTPTIPSGLKEPTVAELALNFAGAMGRWASAGFKTVDETGYARRSAICEACEFWDGAARLGLGKCKAPGCGCTKLKRWMASERCPLKKW